MILYSILLFAAAAIMGLSLVILGVRYQRGSLTLGLTHAGIGLLALGVLLVGIYQAPTKLLYNNAALLFILAVAGGLVLFAVRKGRTPPPMFMVSIHAAMALLALALLVMGYLR